MAKNSYLAPVDPNASGELNSPTLKEVQEQFFEWRKQRKFGARIPETLWSHALSLSPSPCLLEIAKPSGGSLRIYASAISFLNININGLIDKFLSPSRLTGN